MPFLGRKTASAILLVSPMLEGRLIDVRSDRAVSLFFSTASPIAFSRFELLFIPILGGRAAEAFLTSRE
jgi:hypothetical protein